MMKQIHIKIISGVLSILMAGGLLWGLLGGWAGLSEVIYVGFGMVMLGGLALSRDP